MLVSDEVSKLIKQKKEQNSSEKREENESKQD